MKLLSKNLLFLFIVLIIIILSLIYYHGQGKDSLAIQQGRILRLKMSFEYYNEKYGCLPKDIDTLKLAISPFPEKEYGIQNIEYPTSSNDAADAFLFYEKKPRRYGFSKGRYFVYKDGIIEFVPGKDLPPARVKLGNPGVDRCR